MAGRTDVSGRKRAFVALLAQGKTYEEAAQLIGVSLRTCERYGADPMVRAALAEAQDRALGDVVRRMNSGAGDALDVLAEIMKNKEVAAGVRVRACDVWLSHAFKARDALDVAERLAEFDAWRQEVDRERKESQGSFNA